MRYILILVLFLNLVHGAEVNEMLYSDVNASDEIKKIRLEVADNLSSDVEVQNKISIQKLFLSKIEALATMAPQPAIETYKLPEVGEISQKEFLKYFENVAINLSKMYAHDKYELAIRERLSSIKEHLKDVPPIQKHEILQGQLEYAYFKWKDIHNTRDRDRYRTYLESQKERFLAAFSRTRVDIADLEKKTDRHNINLQKLYQKKVYLELRLEKETINLASQTKDGIVSDLNQSELLDNLEQSDKNWKYKFVRDELKAINIKISEQIKEKNEVLILRQIDSLQKDDLETYIIVRGIMENFSHDLSEEDRKMFLLEQKVLEWLKYEHVGDLTAVLYDFEAWVSKKIEKTAEFFRTPLFYQNDRPVDFFDFVRMFITILIGFIIASFYRRRVVAAQRRITFIQKQSFKVMGNIGYYLIVIITVAISLSNIGLDLSSLSLVAGALSVGIGFGLKEVVGNFVSGIILMAERSVKIGDFVEVDNGILGNITDIRMRSVTIKTSSNIDIVVPNSELVQHSFTNYTLEEPVRRLSIPFTVAYGVSYEQVNEAIMKALDQSELTFIRGSSEYENEVIMSGMDERGVNYILFVFVSTYGPNARSSFFRLVYNTLSEKGLPIPSPKLDVNVLEK